MERRTVVFRCDASIHMGGGHVVRCMALANAFQDEGWIPVFVTPAQTQTLFPNLLRDFPGSFIVSSDGSKEIDGIKGLAERPVLMVFDGYHFDTDCEAAFADIAEMTMAIDDMPNRPHRTDILLDQTLGREGCEYEGLLSSGSMMLCGSDYALLRPEFAAQRQLGILPVAEREKLQLLVCFGLTDASNATELFLSALQGLPVTVDVVIGDEAPHRESVAELVLKNQPNWHLLGQLDALAMAQCIGRADVVIGAPGSGSYERCCLGRPSVLAVLAENQLPNARSLEALGAALVLGDAAALDVSTLHEHLSKFLSNRDDLRTMGCQSSKVTDGMGAARTVARVSELIGGK